MNTNIIGFVLSIAIAGWSVMLSAKDPSVYFNAHSIVLVVGGTFTVGLLAYKPAELMNLFKVALQMFARHSESGPKAIRQLVDISKSKVQAGRLEKSFSNSHPFIIDGLRLIDNQFSRDDIEEILSTMVMERKHEFQREIEIVNTLAKYPPAFGMVGTVLGLVSMLGSITVDSNVSTIGPNMAVALATTFYGLVLSNYILTPMSDNLSNRLKSEMNIRRIIMKGILLLYDKQDPVYVEESLNAHVLPKLRTSSSHPVKSAA